MKTTVSGHHGIEQVERLLELTLQPVSPRQEFISQLRRQVLRINRPAEHYGRDKNSHYVLLAVASIASATFLLITGTRAVLSLMGAMSMIHLLKKEATAKRLEASRTAA